MKDVVCTQCGVSQDLDLSVDLNPDCECEFFDEKSHKQIIESRLIEELKVNQRNAFYVLKYFSRKKLSDGICKMSCACDVTKSDKETWEIFASVLESSNALKVQILIIMSTSQFVYIILRWKRSSNILSDDKTTS